METDARDLWQAWRRHRSQEAFAALVKAQVPYVYDFARRMGCAPADADEAVQDALVLLARETTGDPARVGVRAWLTRRVRLRTRNRRRAAVRRRRRERASARPERTADPTEQVAVRDEVAAALDQLEEHERQAVVLRYLHDLDYREMAYVLGLSEGACRVRVHRAVGRLRKALGGHATALVGAVGLFASPAPAALAAKAVATTGGFLTAGGVLLMSTTMKVALAAVLGAAVTALGIFASGSAPERGATRRTPEGRAAAPAPAFERASPGPANERPPERFATGTAILRIGDRYRFGDAELTEGDADIVCLDIRDGAVLATPHGADEARLPILPDRARLAPDDAYALVADAPEELAVTRLRLPAAVAETASGVGLVRTGSGEAVKVVVTRVEDHDDALRRRVHLAYARVPAAAGGGAVMHPDGVALRQPSGAVMESIRRLIAVPAPFAARLEWLRVRTVGSVGTLPDELVVGPERQIALDGPLDTTLSVTGPGTYSRLNPIGPALVYAPGGVAAGGSLNGRSWSVFLIDGDVLGTVMTNTFAYVRVTGSIEGTLAYYSLGHGVVDGGIRGTLRLNSSATVLVRGAVHDPASIQSRSAATLYLQQMATRHFIESTRGSSAATLHVQTSDLAPGSHEKIGGWGTVVVADPVWAELTNR